jgi:hypothetical protein
MIALDRHWRLALAGLALVLATYPTFAWALRPEHFFIADDWGWLYRSAFQRPSEYASFWPQWVYNDRPVGSLFITAVYRLFGLDNVAFNRVWIGLHLLNTLLVFALGLRLLGSVTVAMAAAYAFGNWGTSTAAPTWVASIFDLLGNTLILASFLTYLSDRRPVRWMSPVFYFLAVRTKETAILLPALLLLHLLLTTPREKWRRDVVARLGCHFGVLAALTTTYGYLFLTQSHGRLRPDEAYYLRFDLFTFASGGSYYFHEMLYRLGRPPLPILAAAVLLVVLVVARRGNVVLLGAAGFLLFLLPVIFLPNHRDVLYLYVPSVFFALAGAGAARTACEFLRRPRLRNPAAALAFTAVFLALPHARAAGDRERNVLKYTSFCRQNLEQVRRRFLALPPGAKFVFACLPPHFNAFAYGPCYSLKIAYGDPSVSCVLVDRLPPEPREPGVIYGILDNGRLVFVP